MACVSRANQGAAGTAAAGIALPSAAFGNRAGPLLLLVFSNFLALGNTLTGTPVPPVERFDQMDLSRAMMRALKEAGYERPTEIQAGVIPLVLDGYDVLGQARTGTGKTASFVIPILEMLSPRSESPGVQAIILVPTRELAVQVHDEVIKLAHGTRVHCVAVYGGKPIRGQIEKLQKGAEIVVGTPGRVLDHLSRGTLRLDDVWCVVLDEADRMLDIGFRPDIEKILRRCPKDRQTLLLSATVPPPILKLAERYMFEPEVLNFSPKNLAVETIEQFYFSVEPERKFELLLKLLDRDRPSSSAGPSAAPTGSANAWPRNCPTSPACTAI